MHAELIIKQLKFRTQQTGVSGWVGCGALLCMHAVLCAVTAVPHAAFGQQTSCQQTGCCVPTAKEHVGYNRKGSDARSHIVSTPRNCQTKTLQNSCPIPKGGHSHLPLPLPNPAHTTLLDSLHSHLHHRTMQQIKPPIHSENNALTARHVDDTAQL
ncbi:hypothetical protein COO60DRAFT_801721 [Scenedesmus sp. NREL 46B-D3]|nr:hypothetical protein COO60DRAFT_801721 [Scenedesmus sp. NREL 46B-D3]